MNKVWATIAIAFAFAAVPEASIANSGQRAAIGVATHTERNQVKVAEVMPGGAAELMGVRAGDVITHVGDRWINSDRKLAAVLRTLKPGDAIELTVKRRGKSLQLTGRTMAR